MCPARTAAPPASTKERAGWVGSGTSPMSRLGGRGGALHDRQLTLGEGAVGGTGEGDREPDAVVVAPGSKLTSSRANGSPLRSSMRVTTSVGTVRAERALPSRPTGQS